MPSLNRRKRFLVVVLAIIAVAGSVFLVLLLRPEIISETLPTRTPPEMAAPGSEAASREDDRTAREDEPLPRNDREQRFPVNDPQGARGRGTTGVVERDIVYCTNDRIPLRLDLYRSSVEGTRPLIIYIHGGGWSGGDKAQIERLPYLELLLKAGFDIASVEYRLSPEHLFPAQIVDVKCSVRFLRANASRLGIDPEKVGAMGFSAGAHLASLLGVAHEDAGFDLGEYPAISSSVAAVVEIAGPTDLTAAEFRDRHRDIVRDTFGNSPVLLSDASPISYVDKSAPPFLIFHGTLDKVVPVTQAKLFGSALREAGIPHTTVIIDQGGHALPDSSRSANRQPAGESNYGEKIVQFFAEHMPGG